VSRDRVLKLVVSLARIFGYSLFPLAWIAIRIPVIRRRLCSIPAVRSSLLETAESQGIDRLEFSAVLARASEVSSEHQKRRVNEAMDKLTEWIG
jgi:hypothetical protein